MFDIGWSEMAVILLVALVVIGPRDLPRVARTMGRWVAKGRAMAREFQNALEDMAREAELDKVKKEIEKAGRTDLGKTVEKTIDPSGELSKAFDPDAKSEPKPARTSGDGKAKPDAAAGPPDEASTAQPKPAAPPADGSAAPAPADGSAPAKPKTTKPRSAPATAPERETVTADPS